MRLFPLFKKPAFLKADQEERVIKAIQQAESRTSGEVRVFIENRCKYVDPLDRAAELFYQLNMNATAQRNAVLVYLAIKDHQLAIFADEGIHAKTGADFWKREVGLMLSHFNNEDYGSGIVTVIKEIGEALCQHFPYQKDIDKNELPDNIVFGK